MMNDAEARDLLRNMVAIPSVSRHEGAIAAFLVDRLRRDGFEAGVDEAGNLVASKGAGPTVGVLLGHIDTVPGHIPVRVEGDVLYGRGSVDAKGSLAAFCVALSRLEESRMGGRITIIGCVEEEVSSSKGARHVVDKYQPQWAVIGEPSGWDAVTLGYKGYRSATIRLRQDRAHGAHDYASACERLVTVWQSVQDKTAGFNAGKKRLFDLLMPRLVAMEGGARNDVTESAALEVQFRLPESLPPAELETWLRPLCEVPGCTVEFAGGVPAWSGPRTTFLHRAFLGRIRKMEGQGRTLLKTGTADLNIVAPAWQCPALAYGPGDASLDHTPDEHIHLSEYLKSVQVLEGVLATLLGESPESQPATIPGQAGTAG